MNKILVLTSSINLLIGYNTKAQTWNIFSQNWFNITDTHYKGYWDDGKIITEWNCPDDLHFPKVDIKSWYNVPVVIGRLPSYEETQNETAVFHYGGNGNTEVKPYTSIIVPKLAYIKSPNVGINELVIIIQIVQTATDTIADYRYVSGGCGGSLLHNFHFLSADEIKKLLTIKLKSKIKIYEKLFSGSVTTYSLQQL